MRLDTAIVLAAIVLALVWPAHQQLTIRALRYSLRQQRKLLRQHAGAIIQLQTTVANTPLQVHAPMATVTKVTATISGDRSLQPHTTNDCPARAPGGWAKSELWGKENGPELFQPSHALRAALAEVPELKGKAIDPDQTLRLARPPALDDIEATITAAGRPLTRAAIAERLGRDIAAEIRDQLLAHTLVMVPTRDEAPAYWPASHPVPGDTLRMGRLPVLPGEPDPALAQHGDARRGAPSRLRGDVA